MKLASFLPLACGLVRAATFAQDDSTTATAAGARLSGAPPGVEVWWALSAGAKIRPQQRPPTALTEGVRLRCARNEREAAQLILRPATRLTGFTVQCGALAGPGNARLDAGRLEALQVKYLDLAQASDQSSTPGLWPDPLLPLGGALELEPEFNHAFWIRAHVPADAPPGVYRGTIALRAAGWEFAVPLELTVYGFALPDRMTCVTAFGFSPGNVFRYHGLKTEADQRLVLEKYWANFAAHHVSPYDPAPLDPIRVSWPDVRPPPSVWDDWTNLRLVTNEVHQGQGALLVHDDRTDQNVTVTFKPLVRIPSAGLRLRFWYRTAIPGHRFLVTLNHHDADRQWMSGRNNDLGLVGDGRWQSFDQRFTNFPPGAAFVLLHLRATRWTDAGEELGLVWFDDVSLTDAGTGAEFLRGGDFERRPRTEPVAPAEQLQAKFDFTAWDRALTDAMERWHFTSFRVDIPGLGGGTFHELHEPSLRGFGEDTPEYPLLLGSYCRSLEAHLAAKGWLDRAYVYWFDEPDPAQYPFVLNGFAKLKRFCPGVTRMLTEQVEPGLAGGPNLWCPITDAYDHARAEERRRHGEKFWWYVCTGPKAPYAGLFIDHPGPEMRVWLWQTFQRGIEGVLVWETTYWTSSAAYPDSQRPQNPYADPMSWTSGYSTPAGQRRPWGNGDGRFLYPPPAAAAGQAAQPVLDGPVDSIRWEHLRDGLEDYEYLCILRRLLAERKGGLPAARQRELAGLLEVPPGISRSLTEFARDGAPIEARRHEIALAIEGLLESAGR